MKLKLVLKKMLKREFDWERGRFQREFNQMLEGFDLWVRFVRDQRYEDRVQSACVYYLNTLRVKAFNYIKRLTRVSRGLKLLEVKAKTSTGVQKALEQILDYSRWIEYTLQMHKRRRMSFVIHQSVVRWREDTVKNKLVKMCIQRRWLQRLKTLTQKSRSKSEGTSLFWKRNRAAFVFKVLKYNAYKKKRKRDEQNSQLFHLYCSKLRKKAFVALLKYLFDNRKLYVNT